MSCRDGFDFTLYFEDLVLALLPVIVFIVLAFVRLTLLYSTRKGMVVGKLLSAIKLVRHGNAMETCQHFHVC